MIRIDLDKNIGRVLFIVEGSQNEFSLLRKIFCDIFHYEYIEKRRKKLNTFVSRNNSASRVAVINTKESNISYITKGAGYLDSMFEMLISEYDFPVDQAAIYYLFDRDPKSNTDTKSIEHYIETLRDPYDNGLTKAGMLLLSYPSIEAYSISNFVEKTSDIRATYGYQAKEIVGKNRNIQLNKLTVETLEHATNEFLDFLKRKGIGLDIDNFCESSKDIFNLEEKEYDAGNGYYMFSMLSLAFLQLGVISIQ